MQCRAAHHSTGSSACGSIDSSTAQLSAVQRIRRDSSNQSSTPFDLMDRVIGDESTDPLRDSRFHQTRTLNTTKFGEVVCIQVNWFPGLTAIPYF